MLICAIIIIDYYLVLCCVARVTTPAGVDGAHSNFLDLVAVFDFVYAVSWREKKKNITVMLQDETTDVNVIFSAICTG